MVNTAISGVSGIAAKKRPPVGPVGLGRRHWERGYIGSTAVSSPDLKAFVLATPFFGGLSDASLELLVSMLVERRFDVGTTVVAEGEPGRSMFIVHSGEFVVSKLADAGRVIRMARLKPGDFFGEMTLIEMQNRSATVVAESPAVHTSSRPENSTRATRSTFMRM